MKKRTLMKVVSVVFPILSLLCLTACGEPKETLHIYNWGDYISDDVLRRFEKEFNCEVQIDVFDSNEAMYAKLKAGASGYDILVPSSYMAKLMQSQEMLAPMDLTQLPNVTQYYDRSYAALSLDPELQYSVPYFVSFTGIGYETTRITDFKPTWHMFERTDIHRRCSLLNDQREVMGCALKTLGHDVNSTNPEHIEAAVALVKTWKQNIAKFEVDDAKRALASGEFFLIQTYSGDMLQVSMEKPTVAFVIPEEGSTVTFDNFVIHKNAANPTLAHAFINFMYRPEIAAANMDEIMYVTPHTEAVKLVDEKLRSNPAFTIPEDVRARCTPLRDLGDENIRYIKAWDRIRAE
ncbi:MAG: spermidine/putrescine ABC transporter substrate-binding protein [Kiritimatiellae bacterium]|nr:spermidine/putrescine ABC transporter substrate-binding protein [Kiritimatiellia bacterium]